MICLLSCLASFTLQCFQGSLFEARISTSLLFTDEYCSAVWVKLTLSIHQLMNIWVFPFLVIMSGAAMNIHV